VAGDGTTFQIDVKTNAGGVESTAAACARLATELAASGTAAAAAAEAVKAGEAAYKQAEASADKAAKALEKIGLAAEAQKGKLAAAAEAGNIAKYNAALEKMNQLTERQAEASIAAENALMEMGFAAAAVDGLRGAAEEATLSQTALAAATDAATKAAAAQGEAATQAAAAIKEQDASIAAATGERLKVELNASKSITAAMAKEDAELAAATAAKISGLAAAANGYASTALAAESAAKKEGAAAKKTADAATKAAAPSGKVNEMGEAFGKLGGPLGLVGQKVFGVAEGFKKMGASIGSAGPYVAVGVAIVAIVAAVAAVTAAAIAGVVAIAAWAVGLADAGRSAELLTDGITGSAKAGRSLDDAIAQLEKRVPQTSAELQSMAATLAKTGLEGEDLRNALEKTAEEAALLKFGPDFAKGANTLVKITDRLKRNLTKMFAGLKIDALLDKLASLAELFDEGSASAAAIKVVFESLFQPLIDVAAAIIPKAITAFIQFQILVMKALIAIMPFGKYIELMGLVILSVGAAIAVGLIAPFVVLVAGAVAVGLALAAAAAVVISLGAALWNAGAPIREGIGAAFDWLIAKVTSIFETLKGMSLADIGIAMINGLVDGIKGAAGAILKAMTGAVSGAIDGAKALLGIASPSKVFAEIGMQTGEGMVQGVDDSAGDVQGSMAEMVDPSAAAAGGAAGGTTATASSGGSTYIITIQGGGDAKSNVEAFAAFLEGLGAQAGTAVPA
jgi:hypothetical protein